MAITREPSLRIRAPWAKWTNSSSNNNNSNSSNNANAEYVLSYPL